MKKISIFAGLLAIVFIISGCSSKTVFYSTVAVPFSDEQTANLGLKEAVDDYHLENVQVYECEDGSKEIYMYSAPVERSSAFLTECEEGYKAAGSYFGKHFPLELSNDSFVEISNGSNYAKIYLLDGKANGNLEKRQNAFGLNKQSIVYEDAFENGEDYICYPTPFGVNTEIVIPKRTKEYKYQIKIQLPNLVPDTSSPDYISFKRTLAKGDVKSLLYTPIIVDKKGNWSYSNSVKLVDKDPENNIYTVEYSIDEKFLNNKKTKFPVTLNQSIYLYKAKQPDTSAYENTGDVASHYLSPYILLGDSTLKGEGWTYVRFETLNSLNIDPEKIVSAKYVFHNLFDLDKEVKVSAYAVTADWCSINTRWYNRPPFDKRPISEVVVERFGDYELDITPLVLEMIRNKENQSAIYSVRNSFLIKSDTDNCNMCISSGDNGLFSPYLKIVVSE